MDLKTSILICKMYTPILILKIMKFQWRFLQPRYWLIWIFFIITWILSCLPYSWLKILGKIVGWLIYKLATKRRNVATINISKCFQELTKKQQCQLVRKHFSSVGMGVMEVIISWWFSNNKFQKLINCSGLKNITANNNTGVILMVMHSTTIELAGRAVANYFSLDAVYRKHDNPLYEYLQFWFRSRHDTTGKMLDKNNLRAILTSLRKKRILWYAPDQDYGATHSVFVPFFGIMTATITTTAKLARIGRAKIVPMSFIRNDNNNSYDLKFYPPLPITATDDNQHQNELNINKFIEKIVKDNPEQYMWLHRRFKTRPPGEDDFYKDLECM